MRIQVLGPGCQKCNELAKRTQEAVEELGLETQVEKVTDLKTIMEHGVMLTPALVVDGTVIFSGKVPTKEELRKLLKT
jgi:small redox-active disulfide protein 2